MPAGNSIIGDCAECCTCPTATVEWDSRSAILSKSGYPYDGFSDVFTTPNGPFGSKRYLTSTAFCGAVTTYPASFLDFSCPDGGCWVGIGPGYLGRLSLFSDTVAKAVNDADTVPRTPVCADEYVFSDEYTTALLISNAEASLPAYDGDWNDTAGSFANLSTDELTYSIRESRYRLRFKIPPTSVYRLTWVERFIGEAGTTIASVDVISRGVYRPTVTLSAPPTGGTQARAIAVMSSAGTISSIRITNPGSGYTSAPTVTVQAAINGGTSSTGWTATLTDGKVTAISGGSAGDYRPTLTFSAPGGTGTTAAATCTVDETGGIDAVSVTAAGSGYTAEPTLTISSKVSVPTAAVLHLHLGTETSKCIAWDGTTPSGYDPATSSTYPILPSSGYYEIAVPTSDGTTLVANVRAYCDNSSC